MEDHVGAEGNEVLIGIKGGNLERALTQQVDDGAVDDEDHAQRKAGVEAGPEVQETLGVAQTTFEESIVPEENLKTTGSPTETLLVEVVDVLG